MNGFSLFFPEGIRHIVSLDGMDHILFISALCLRYLVRDWKKLLVVVTAFTIGHSLTLALSTLNIVSFSRTWTEFLIALTILITAVSNLFVRDFQYRERLPAIYFYAVFFGLIHGLGFSSMLKSLFGRDANIVGQLLAFNLGIETGQLVIVAIVLFLSWLVVNVAGLNRKDFLVFASGGIAALALELAIQRIP